MQWCCTRPVHTSRAGEQGGPLERIERELTLLMRRAQKVHLHSRGPEHPLDRSAYAILGLLRDGGPQRPGELAERFHLDASTVSRQVTALERSQLVTRVPDPHDGRAYRLELTAQGVHVLDATRRYRRAVVRELLGSWPMADQEAFGALLARFNAGLGGQLTRLSTSTPDDAATPTHGPRPEDETPDR